MIECQYNSIASFYIRVKLSEFVSGNDRISVNLLAAVLGERKSLKQTLNQMGY